MYGLNFFKDPRFLAFCARVKAAEDSEHDRGAVRDGGGSLASPVAAKVAAKIRPQVDRITAAVAAQGNQVNFLTQNLCTNAATVLLHKHQQGLWAVALPWP